MDTPPLPLKPGPMLVSLYNKTVKSNSLGMQEYHYYQSLPVTGEALLRRARELFKYNGAPTRLVKTSGKTRMSNRPLDVVQDSHTFSKKQHSGTSIDLVFTSAWPRPNTNPADSKRRTQRTLLLASEDSFEGDIEVDGQVELPFYKASKKMGKVLDVTADPEDVPGGY
ncbi:hypothetical protein GGI21_000182 [Coemansia aciculifera]|nr:hypothetical protein GGI21_000182 [Coemansia aciculifera]